eukprot:TRINITY_DN181_c0_g1_i1.p2 TRINITY_DN181_c0_g1~~TRINITY_DN181_c0_g1_i1.p2  ORF type:complete len:143 (-),score=7.24 TRINITY_DN181_c0_g1_i1:839-1267(-)
MSQAKALCRLLFVEAQVIYPDEESHVGGDAGSNLGTDGCAGHEVEGVHAYAPVIVERVHPQPLLHLRQSVDRFLSEGAPACNQSVVPSWQQVVKIGFRRASVGVQIPHRNVRNQLGPRLLGSGCNGRIQSHPIGRPWPCWIE